MKKYNQNCCLTCFAIFLLSSFSIQSQTTWSRVTPNPQENTINDLFRIPGGERIIAVCENSTYMFTIDFGDTWDVRTNPGGMNNQFDCFAAYFTDSQTGFITGSWATILKTTDGGQTWNAVYSGSSLYDWAGYYDIKISSNGIGIAVGYEGHILRTIDWGDTWQSVVSSVDFDLNAVVYPTDNDWITVGDNPEIILISDDGGANWVQQIINPPLSGGTLQDIFFTSVNTGSISWDHGSGSKILRTENGGLTWEEVWSDYGYFPKKIDFYDVQHGAISCGMNFYNSGMLRTSDGGLTWIESSVDEFSWYANNAILMSDNQNALMAGSMGMIFQSFEGGAGWIKKYNRKFWGEFLCAQFTDSSTGYALATSHTGGMATHDFFKTVNGGLNWDIIGSGDTYYEASFYFLNNETGYYCYNNSSLNIFKTQSGGDDWILLESGSFDFNPMGIKFYNENLGMICGPNDIIRTQDGGETWETVYSGVFTDDHWDIHFKSADEILVCGSFILQTNLLHSTDGGDFWDEIIPPDYGSAYDLEFVNTDTGFMACEKSMILKTTDGGTTWAETTMNADSGTAITKIRFIDDLTGYATAIGPSANLFKTTDQGNTWNPVITPATAGLYDLHFFDTETGFVFGQNGIIMKTGDFLTLNPPQNFTIFQEYLGIQGLNVFHLTWDTPDTTNTPELTGYNIYRCNELLDYLPADQYTSDGYIDTIPGSNGNASECGEGPICYHVTAIYENPPGESLPTQDECGIMLITSVNEPKAIEDGIVCSPNPFNENLRLYLPGGINGPAIVVVYNSYGKQVNTFLLQEKHKEAALNLSNLKPGVYLLEVQCGNRIFTKKIIKSR